MSHTLPTIPNKKRQNEITFKDDSKSNTKNQSKYKIQSIFQELGKKSTMITSRFWMMLKTNCRMKHLIFLNSQEL